MLHEKITNISNESKYHSFLIAQTQDKEVAQKWQYYILSSNGQLLMSTEEGKSSLNYEYNISIDTVAYEVGMGSTRVILSQGDWLKPCMSVAELQLLHEFQIVRYDSLVFAKPIKFYYYVGSTSMSAHSLTKQIQHQNAHGNHSMSIVRNTLQQVENWNPQAYTNYGYGEQFVQIRPSYIHNKDCLIFQIDSAHAHHHHPPSKNGERILENAMRYILRIQYFKHIHSLQHHKLIPHKNDTHTVIFKSQYALISDQHFLNCLVRGSKLIGSYVKIGGYYVFWMDQQIYMALRKLYAGPKL